MSPSEVAECTAKGPDCGLKHRLPPRVGEPFLPAAAAVNPRKKRRSIRRRNPERSLVKYRAERFDMLLSKLLSLTQTTYDDKNYANPQPDRVPLALAVEIAARVVCGGK